MKKLLLANMLIAMLLGAPAYADDLQSIMSSTDTVVARTARGIIRSIDLDKRTAIIGGFMYAFGPPSFPIKVTMLNASTGSIEMLRSGMKVEVVYGEFGTSRIAASIKQLPSDANVED